MRLRTFSVQVMPITPMNKNTACAIIAAVDVLPPVKPPCAWRQGRLQKYLAEKFGIEIRGCLTQMGDIPLEIKDWSQVEQNPFFCPDPDKIDALDELMRALKKEGDSIGAKVTVVASGVPAGLGEPVFDRLDADIAHALMSINAVKVWKLVMV